MLQPKKTKFRKAFKGRIHGASKGGTELNFGQFGLKAMEPERITARQIEAARRAMTRHMKRARRVWIRIFPDVPGTKKPTEGQGRHRALGLQGRAGTHHVRARWRAAGDREGSADAGGGQAADQDAFH